MDVSDAALALDKWTSEDDLTAFSNQLYSCLVSTTERDAFEVITGAEAGDGLDAWRRLSKRYDPLSSGRARGLLREILTPGRSKLHDLAGSIERLEDLVRRYRSRRDGA